LIALDNSDEAVRAAQRIMEIVKDSKPKRMDTLKDKEKKDVKNIDLPNIIAFHSTEHQSFLEKIPIMVPSSFGASYLIPATDYRKLQEEYTIHGKKILKKTETVFNKNHIDIETRLVTEEKPEDYIEKAVEKENFDLVVLGSKGEHSKLEQIFSGTVAQKVVDDVPCDVLIVR